MGTGLHGVQERPWFGVGYGMSKRQYQFRVRPSTYSHNLFLQVAFELGIVGLAEHLVFWGVVLGWSVRRVRRAKDLVPVGTARLTAISVALVGSMVAGLFENYFFDAEVRTMILGLMGSNLRDERPSGVAEVRVT